jgi:hypothetical protein
MRRQYWLLLAFVTIVGGVSAFALYPRKERAARDDAARLTTEPQIRRRLFVLLRPVTIANCRLERFGEPNDGGYLLCGNLLSNVRAGYSYGISGYDGWGCDLSRRLTVPVHEYDCFDTRKPECPGGNTIFHAECVGSATATIEGRPFDSIERQIAANGDAGKSIVVKIDVEGAEWESFLATPTRVLERIDQMAVEFHGVREARFVAVVEKLRETFHVAHFHVNNYSCSAGIGPFAGWAYEVLFVNKRIGVADGTAASAAPHPLDAPNNPAASDCQR